MAASAYSDDHGDTWRLGRLIEGTADGGAPNENKVAALSDGRLLLHSRATPRRLAAVSDDGGHSWSTPVPVADLPDPSDNGSLARFDGLPSVTGLAAPATDSWLLATNNHDPNLRRNTVLSLSTDDGATWPAKLVLCPGSSAYSTATRLPDGKIGVLYERQGYREIVFASGTARPAHRPAFVTGCSRARRRPAASEPGLVFDMELRSDHPRTSRRVAERRRVPRDGVRRRRLGRRVVEGDRPGPTPRHQAQVLGTREAQDLNYGPVIPGYKAGDILAFTGRARNDGSHTARDVRLHGPGAGEFRATDLPPGQEVLYFTPTYTVTAEDVEQDALRLPLQWKQRWGPAGDNCPGLSAATSRREASPWQGAPGAEPLLPHQDRHMPEPLHAFFRRQLVRTKTDLEPKDGERPAGARHRSISWRFSMELGGAPWISTAGRCASIHA